jgi:hypothetical protein
MAAVEKSTAVLVLRAPLLSSRGEVLAVDEISGFGHERRRDTSPHREAAHLKGWSE